MIDDKERDSLTESLAIPYCPHMQNVEREIAISTLGINVIDLSKFLPQLRQWLDKLLNKGL